MSELFKVLKDFIVRDIIYITGGVSVILSFLYSRDRINVVFGTDLSIYTVIYIAAIGYVIGWFIQDISALIPGLCMTTSLNYKPGEFIQNGFRKFIGVGKKYNLKHILDKPIDEIEASIKINKEEGRNIAEVERIVSHVLIGTSIGPCWFVSGIILLLDAFDKENSELRIFALIVLLVSIGIIIIGRIKLVRLKEFTIKLCEDIDKGKSEQAKEKRSDTSQDKDNNSTDSASPKNGR